MNRDRIIDYLLAEHHRHCCDCAAYRESAKLDATELLLHEYVILFGDKTQAEADRLRAGDAEALCQEIAKKKGHAL